MSEHSQGELEARLLYAVIVAGKSADFADKACARLWAHCQDETAGIDPPPPRAV